MKSLEKPTVNEELKQFHCSLLLDEVREKVRKLKSYGIDECDIISAMREDDLFPLLIVSEDYKVLLSGEKEVEVQMEPLVKAVYLLFLLHPEGIILKRLPDYRDELRTIYQLLRPAGITPKAEKSIMDVTNPMLNSINEKCARIRHYFTSLLPSNVAYYYSISGKRGELKKIALDRVNVIWMCNIPHSTRLVEQKCLEE